jgi:amidase
MKSTQVHAFDDDALGTHDAVALAALIKRRGVSSAELVEAAIARAERVDVELAAIQLRDYLKARAITELPHDGVFAGIPSFIKDNTNIVGWSTCHGSRAVPPEIAKKDGEFARQFLSLGVILLGKTRLPEFGFNCSTEFQDDPPCRNPWHTDYTCGGSSGGSAALVAAGVVPLAHANDGGGSIRIPAANCGLVGLKVTRGRFVTHEIAKSLPLNILTDGVVTRSVRDTAHAVAGMEGFWRSGKFPEIGLVEGPGKRKLRVGLMLHSLTGKLPCEQTRNAVESMAQLLENEGHSIEPMSPPCKPSFAEDFGNYWGFLAFVAGRLGKREFGKQFDRHKLDRFTKGLAGLFVQSWPRTPVSLIRLRRSWQMFANAMKNFDAVLSPVVAHVTPKLGHLSPQVEFETLIARIAQYACYTPLNNANGSPAIAIPAGLSSEGLPIGVQLAARHGDERTLLELAYQIEQRQPWPQLYMHSFSDVSTGTSQND